METALAVVVLDAGVSARLSDSKKVVKISLL
jgi:CTP:molybdopterin cytidylyltransferase MocA